MYGTTDFDRVEAAYEAHWERVWDDMCAGEYDDDGEDWEAEVGPEPDPERVTEADVHPAERD